MSKDIKVVVYRLYDYQAANVLEGNFYMEMRNFSEMPSIIKRFENTN
jgi:hypothetical protein